MIKCFVLSGTVLALVISVHVARADAPSDEQARSLAIEAVEKVTGTPKDELNTKRLEDLEDDLFFSQRKVRGQIRKGAYFYQVGEGGYQISPDDVTYRPNSAQSWFVAVSTSDGETFGLYGFKDADQSFEQLLKRIPVVVSSPTEAEILAKFYLQAVYKARANIVHGELWLRQEVETHFVGYSNSRDSLAKKEEGFRQWWNAFKAKHIGSLEPIAKGLGSDRYLVQVKVLEMTVGRPPELWEWSIEVQKDGVTRLSEKQPVFPSAAKSTHVNSGSSH